MPTSIANSNTTKVGQELQKDLAEYGVLRSRVMAKAPPKTDGTPNFFGIKRAQGEVELSFDSLPVIQDKGMTIALVAPENESFNMLVTTDFKKAVSGSTPDKLRDFLRRIVDKV